MRLELARIGCAVLALVMLTGCGGSPAPDRSGAVSATASPSAPAGLPPTQALPDPSAIPSPLPPTPTRRPSSTPIPSPTRLQLFKSFTPTSTDLPTLAPSPTWSIQATRTPAALAAECPRGGEPAPVLTVSQGERAADLEPQLLAFLNAVGSSAGMQGRLEAISFPEGETDWKARAQVRAADVTGDRGADILVSLYFYQPSGELDGALFGFTCQAGSYASVLSVPLSGWLRPGSAPDPGFRAVQDLNADGVLEIVYSYIGEIRPSGDFLRRFLILEWDGSGFSSLVSGEKDVTAALEVDNGDGALRDVDRNRSVELLLNHTPGAELAGNLLARPFSETWSWNGRVFSLQRIEYAAPVYRFQAVYDADAAFGYGDTARALQLYQKVIRDTRLLGWSRGRHPFDSFYGVTPTPAPETDETALLSAYAAYRILLLHTVQGQTDAADQDYREMAREFPQGKPGNAYLKLAGVLRQAYQSSADLSEACRQAVDYAAAHPAEILDPLEFTLAPGSPPHYQPEDLCPLP